MNVEILVSRVLDDESLIGELNEKAAETLIAWAVKQAEQIAAKDGPEKAGLKQMEIVCRRAKAIGQLATALCKQRDQSAAAAIAKKEALPWPVAESSSEEKTIAWLLAQEKPR